ncbi:MAG: hypothetical protein JST48_04855 [Bacteroidetes bacterium]|nr:hypothetical protein [Bacteroidota bacterium]
MKPIKFLIVAACFGLLASCSKSSSPAPLSPSDAQASLTSSNSTLSSELTSVTQTTGYTSLNTFSALTSGTGISPFSRIAYANHNEVANQLKIALANVHVMMVHATATARINGDEPFNYNDKKGIYTYNFNTKKFDYSSQSDIVEIKYPSDSTKKTNNADFQLTAYSEVKLSDGTYGATNVQATLSVDGTKQAEVKFTANYDDKDDPNLVSLNLYLNPYTWTIDFDNTKPTSTSESVSLSKNEKLLIGTGISATYASASDKEGGSPSSASGYIQLVDVRFTISLNMSAPNANPNDPNTFVFITITVNGSAAGKVIFDQTDPQNPVPYVQFNDGTKTKLETLFQSFGDELSKMFS